MIQLNPPHHDLPLQPVHLSAGGANDDSSKLHQQRIQCVGVVPPHCCIKGLEEPGAAAAVECAARQLLTIKRNVGLEPAV
jgi:hypothetical protein